MMSDFRKWFNSEENEEGFDLYNYPEEAMEKAWNKQQLIIDGLSGDIELLNAKVEELVCDLRNTHTELFQANALLRDLGHRDND